MQRVRGDPKHCLLPDAVLQAVRRAWNLPDKRAVLSSVANLMLCGAADVHQDLENMLASLPSSTVNHVGGVASKQRWVDKRGFQR